MNRLPLLRFICGLFVFTLPIASAPVSVSYHEVAPWPGFSGGAAVDVALSGTYAYLASQSGGLVVLDVSNPAKPMRVGVYGGFYDGRITKVLVTGETCIALNADFGIDLLDISNPISPQRLQRISGAFLDIFVLGQTLCYRGYAVGENYNLFSADISNPAEPKTLLIGNTDTQPMVQFGSRLLFSRNTYTGNGYEVLFNPVDGSIRDLGKVLFLATAGASTGNYAYATASWAQAYDISNPDNPQAVGGYFDQRK